MGGNYCRFPTLAFRVFRIHPKQVRGEEGGFLAAGARTDFNDHVAPGVSIVLEQERADFLLNLFFLGVDFGELLPREPGQFRVGAALQNLRGLSLTTFERLQRTVQRCGSGRKTVFFGAFAVFGLIGDDGGVGESPFQLGRALRKLGNPAE